MPAVKHGSRVTIQFPQKSVQTVCISDSRDAAPECGVIVVSPLAPLAQAILGKREGERVCYRVEARIFEIAIVKVDS